MARGDLRCCLLSSLRVESKIFLTRQDFILTEKFKSQSCHLKTQNSLGSLWKEVLGEVRPQWSLLGYGIVFTSL